MRITVEKILYFDPQARPHTALCEKCGGCLYAPSMACLRCDRRDGP